MAYHHGDLRRALLRGALELLGEGGPGGLTLRGVARRAGVSQAAPYRHFTDKQALLAAVAEEGFLSLERACQEAVTLQAAADDPLAAFRLAGLAYVRFAIEHPAHYRVMFGPEIPDTSAYEGLQRAAQAAYESLRTNLRRCAEAGCFDAAEIERRAVHAWALAHGLASLFIDGQLPFGGESGKDDFLAEAGAVLALEALAPVGSSRAIESLPLPRGADFGAE